MFSQILSIIRKKRNDIYVIEKNRTWTYLDLEQSISYFNNFFKVHRYEKILLSGRQGFIEYSILLSAYMTGCIFCVLNPQLPLERKKHIISKFSPDLIIGYEKDEILRVNNVKRISIDNIFNEIAVYEKNEIVRVFENHIMYVLFTSGSTGLPKGCKIKRDAFEKHCKWAVNEFGISSNDVYGQYVPLYFDMSLIDVFGATQQGAALVPFKDFNEKSRPGNMIKKYSITFMNVVPQFLDILITTKQLTEQYLKSLRMIRFGGDKIFVSKLEKLFDNVPFIKVISTYGPTETTCFCFYKMIDINNYKRHSKEIVTIGNPIPGWYAYLKDVENNVGEIVIYGNNIGEGYIDDLGGYCKEIIDGELVNTYHTGDYASYENGEYYFEGRRDSQIKIFGNRVSMVEVEYSMLEIGCDEVAVLYHNNEICCFYISNNEELKKEIDVKKLLKSKLPFYAIPTKIRRINIMPYNANGKIDRNQLKLKLIN